MADTEMAGKVPIEVIKFCNDQGGSYSTMDFPRINQFPEWFTADKDTEYQLVSTEPELNGRYTGEELIAGQICYIILK